MSRGWGCYTASFAFFFEEGGQRERERETGKREGGANITNWVREKEKRGNGDPRNSKPKKNQFMLIYSVFLNITLPFSFYFLLFFLSPPFLLSSYVLVVTNLVSAAHSRTKAHHVHVHVHPFPPSQTQLTPIPGPPPFLLFTGLRRSRPQRKRPDRKKKKNQKQEPEARNRTGTKEKKKFTAHSRRKMYNFSTTSLSSQ